jgi:2,3-bisphosphoglycerate-independent phosphoglycerate mutase
MKYLILHAEGFADGPQPGLSGKSVLEAAKTPNLDRIARCGEFGWAAIPSEGMAPTGELTGLTILGYDPHKYSTGPAPLEAAGLGITVGEHDVVYRCNLVTMRSDHPPAGRSGSADPKKLSPQAVLEDARAGGIETDEARDLVDALNEQVGSETIQFYPGERHEHFMVWVNGKARAVCHNPKAVEGHQIGEYLPSGDGADILRKLMDASMIILRDHPVNQDRRHAGLKAANCLWLWGQGRAPLWPPVTERFGITGSVVTLSTLHRGLGICAGFEAVDLDGAEEGPAQLTLLRQSALAELSRKDLVYLHVNLENLASSASDEHGKAKAVSVFDQDMVGPLLEELAQTGPSRILVICDQSEQFAEQKPAAYQALVALLDTSHQSERSSNLGFDEAHATQPGAAPRDGLRLLARLLKR